MRKRSPAKRRVTRRTVLKALPSAAAVGGAVGIARTARVATAATDADEPSYLLVEGTGPVTRFSFGVTGTVEGRRLEDTDSVYDSRVDGQVSTQDDAYLFTGDLRSFEVTDGNVDDIRVTVDGDRVQTTETDQRTTTATKELVVAGSGPVTKFEFQVTGEVEGTDLEPSDTIYDYAVEGQVSTQSDTYRFTGDLDGFVVNQGRAEDITVTVDGDEIAVEELETHVLEVHGSGPVTRFSLAVSGAVSGVDLENTDTVRLHSVEGQVSTQSDRYEYSGRMNSFEVTEGSADDIVLVHDGVETTVAELDG